ncbi:AI-2E family transporter [Acetobacterium wieringae]|uniref:AI-2E family transporter n=1 Tax=Acetobacterium wieringae TaxID=52694 RepID=A0ABY6HG37_9FIRM|nr:AI-2E family transporter [Acetobacterium wieringae]UYO63479.1 AI-2E family transporter [Acetobacterium wieringae]VUZ26179.1 Uncharacterised protein [Acetobacterium wieringae]
MKFKIDQELVKKYSYLLVGILILILSYKLLDNFGVVTQTLSGMITRTLEVLMPILLGVVLAYFLFRPMRGVEKFIFKTVPRSQNKARVVRLLSILIVYVITIILIVLFFYATIPSVIESLTGLIAQTPEYLTIIDNYLGESLAKGGAAQDILTELKVAIDSLQNMTAMDVLNQLTTYFGANPDSIKNIGNFAFVFLKGTIGFVITFIDDPSKAFWVAIWILVVQQFDGNVLAPNVLGKIVELNPFWVLFSVIVGGSLFGLLGMFVAIPMFAVIKVFFEEGLTRWERKKEALEKLQG